MNKTFFFLLAFLTWGVMGWAQSVIFPQEQQAGTAVSQVSDGVYTLSNDLLSASSDYHRGFSGTAKTDHNYSFVVPVGGDYTLRYLAVLNPDGSDNTSSGNINLSYAKDYYYHLPAPTETEIQGEWSRQTTLQAGKTTLREALSISTPARKWWLRIT